MLVIEKRLVDKNPKRWVEILVLSLHPYVPTEFPFVTEPKTGEFWCQEHQFPVRVTQEGDNYYFHMGHWGSPMNGELDNNNDYYLDFMEREKSLASLNRDIGVRFKEGW